MVSNKKNWSSSKLVQNSRNYNYFKVKKLTSVSGNRVICAYTSSVSGSAYISRTVTLKNMPNTDRNPYEQEKSNDITYPKLNINNFTKNFSW